MKKLVMLILGMYFFMLSVAPDMQGLQYFKTGELIEHFKKDNANKELSFSQFLHFLKEHYVNDLDLTQDNHHSLPFKSHQSPSFLLSFQYQVPQAVIEEISFTNQSTKGGIVLEKSPNLLSFSVWNPPRM